MLKFLRNNGLSLTLFALFVAFLVGESLVGHVAYNQRQSAYGAQPVGFWHYLTTGDFLDGVFSNWQAAILQLASLIIFGVFLVQRGATHSRKHLEPDPKHKALKRRPFGRARSWIYRNSLFLAFLALFLATSTLHLFTALGSARGERPCRPPSRTDRGAETDRCLLSTILDAVDRGFRVVLPVDAVCSSSDERRDNLLAPYGNRFSLQIEVAETGDILAGWHE